MAFPFSQKKKHPDPQNEAEEIITKAQRKSENLLTEATKEAQLIISETQSFREELQKSLKDDVAFQAEQFSNGYQELLPEIKKYYQESIDKQLRTFGNQLEGFTSEMTQILKKQLTDLSTLLKEQAAQEFTTIQQEMAAYKKQKMEEIDQTTMRIVKRAVSEIIGSVISPNEHQELIMKALEKAKKEGVFEK